MQAPGIHTVVHSFDVLGASHSLTIAWISRKLHDESPRLYRALMDALAGATEILNGDKRAAAQLWMEDAKSKLPPDLVYEAMSEPQVKCTLVPARTMEYASFMYDVGIVKAVPATWKDLFFPKIHGVDGS